MPRLRQQKARSVTLLVVAVIGFVTPRAGEAATTLVGTIGVDRTLSARGNPHVVDGTVTIPTGVTVKAGSGVRFVGNDKSILAVKQGGELHLLGAPDRRVILERVALSCRGSTLLAKHCEMSSPAQTVVLYASGAARIWVRHSRFSGCEFSLGNRGAIKLSNCHFEESSFSFGVWGWSGPYGAAESCVLSKCRIALGFMVIAGKCDFRNCEFPGELSGEIGLRKPVIARSSVFCDKSWKSVQNAEHRASFPDKPLIVKRARSLKPRKR